VIGGSHSEPRGLCKLTANDPVRRGCDQPQRRIHSDEMRSDKIRSDKWHMNQGGSSSFP